MTPEEDRYNVERFTLDNFDYYRFPGPRAGELAGDFLAWRPDGSEVRLSDYRGRWVVIEWGSVTCGMYARNIDAANAMARRHPDVSFLVLYTREAHPGEKRGRHTSFDDKLSAARQLKPLFNEDRDVIVDGLDGAIHQSFSSCAPNAVYVINPQGIVTFRSDWMVLEAVETALQNPDQIFTKEHAFARERVVTDIEATLRAVRQGGDVAMQDLLRLKEEMGRNHVLIDEYYERHGRLG